MRRDENNARAVAQNNVARHDDGVADVYRRVDPQNNDTTHRRGMRRAEVDLSGQVKQAFQVADTAVHHRAAAGGAVDRSMQIVAAEVMAR